MKSNFLEASGLGYTRIVWLIFPREIEELIARFDRNIEAYQNQVYNETQVRRE